ncbi:glycosyltransferase family A protein [Marinibactrum halimedae]|uniref:Glycosyltransferase 2-like domain-containing protein n=1 Tax=Marinibactrum halimedae TaxID=1444977 RepID=A0AA37T9K6_9GAMM|nr:glycosyltransferase family 2 protein [Marinibactrum halimedae]MCD9458383.1 glycosyltransferase family 2 protein [Marinibactrum halimedae]GLS26080.1 hypothetical protein GCM10007877_17950 [Marinibactrum halimedae]
MTNCAVITPIGPGHEQRWEECLTSILSAHEYSKGPFSEIKAFPVEDIEGKLGRSHARNLGVEMAINEGFDWIFFLDADDFMVASAFESVTGLIEEYDAIWGAIAELSGETAQLRPKQEMEIQSFEQLIRINPFLSLQMGHFVKASIAKDNPFDESMDTGEDFDYYLKVWAQYRAVKQPLPLFINRRGMHSTGPRSATGEQWNRAVSHIIQHYHRHGKEGINIPLS